MATTLTNLLLHIVFSTKNREAWITKDVEHDLYAYIGGICRGCGCTLRNENGTENHVHLVVSLSKTVSVAELLLNIKRDSSSWMKGRGTVLRDFHWQEGYAAFSVGNRQLPALSRYIDQQKDHHRTRTFQEEFRELLNRHDVEFDESYVWG